MRSTRRSRNNSEIPGALSFWHLIWLPWHPTITHFKCQFAACVCACVCVLKFRKHITCRIDRCFTLLLLPPHRAQVLRQAKKRMIRFANRQNQRKKTRRRIKVATEIGKRGGKLLRWGQALRHFFVVQTYNILHFWFMPQKRSRTRITDSASASRRVQRHPIQVHRETVKLREKRVRAVICHDSRLSAGSLGHRTLSGVGLQSILGAAGGGRETWTCPSVQSGCVLVPLSQCACALLKCQLFHAYYILEWWWP